MVVVMEVVVVVLGSLSISDVPLFMQEEAAWAQVSLGGAALREARAELAEARKQWHSLQVEIETLHALVRKHVLIWPAEVLLWTKQANQTKLTNPTDFVDGRRPMKHNNPNFHNVSVERNMKRTVQP